MRDHLLHRDRLRSAVLLSVLFLLAPMAHANGPTTTSRSILFDILRGNKVLGHVTALMSERAGHTRYRMTSTSEFSLGWKQQVHTIVDTEYLNGELMACHSSIQVNRSLRDSSHMARGADRCYVHPEQAFLCERATQWTTARMYFEEPVGQDHIFVESQLRDLPLQRIGAGIYTLTFPDGKQNRYHYAEGLLREIHVDRGFFTLVFRRR